MSQLEIIHDRIRDWIFTNFPLAAEQGISSSDSLLDHGIIDSLGTLELVQFLESEFAIQITDDEMVADHFDSIHSISQFVESKIANDENKLKAT